MNCPLSGMSLVSCEVVERLANPKPTDLVLLKNGIFVSRGNYEAYLKILGAKDDPKASSPNHHATQGNHRMAAVNRGDHSTQ